MASAGIALLGEDEVLRGPLVQGVGEWLETGTVLQVSFVEDIGHHVGVER
ncbi:hypothetical protein [[Micrococcus luteus] ATCC 49442]|nr:hypothetical protein [[Micrococcus luteus] ATCC 49442]